MTSRFHLYSHFFCPTFTYRFHPLPRIPPLFGIRRSGWRDADNGFNSVRIDRRAKKRFGESSERRIDGPGTMVNFGSNRLIPEFQLASTVWLDLVLHAFRGILLLPFLFPLNLCYYARTLKFFNPLTYADYPFP